MSLDLGGLEREPAAGGGSPLLLPVDAIDADDAQPRREYDQESLAELAQTIRERGVRQPVSVRPHPDCPGRWILNFGSRRLKASKLAGRDHIPAFVDLTVEDYDQVIENEQREPLTPMELAIFIKKRLGLGDVATEIARRLGRSKAYVTRAMALVDAPDWLVEAYRGGRCTGQLELYELRRLGERDPAAARELASRGEPVRRSAFEALRQRAAGPAVDEAERGPVGRPGRRPETRRSRPEPPRLYGELDGQVVELVVDWVPAVSHQVFVRRTEAGAMQAVPARRLRLIGFGREGDGAQRGSLTVV